MKRHLGQRAGVMVTLAIALPMLLAFVGLSIDVGNYMLQSTRLQNATDAAALAGGNVYAAQGLTPASHVPVDQEARSYLVRTAQNGMGNISETEQVQAQYLAAKDSETGTEYYRVHAQKPLDLYFIKIFYRKPVYVSTTSTVRIGKARQKVDAGKNLFMVWKEFKAVNTIEHPDYFRSKKYEQSDPNTHQPYACLDTISTTFDGALYYSDNPDLTKGEKHDTSYQAKVAYSTQNSDDVDRLFTSKSFDGNRTKDSHVSWNDPSKKTTGDLSLKTIMDSKETRYDVNSGKTTGDGYWSRASYHAYDFDAYLSYVRDLVSEVKAVGDAQVSLASQVKADTKFVRLQGNGNKELSITADVKGAADDPLYVFIDPGASVDVIHFDTTSSNTRPIILVVDGDRNNMHTKLEVNFKSGTTFRGLIYAPYLNEDGLHVNATNVQFIGSMIANTVYLNSGNMCNYRFYDWSDDHHIDEYISSHGKVTLLNSKDSHAVDGLSWLPVGGGWS